uniref:Regulator of chromosome condensation family protein isoform 1 n=1 Tax=Tetraselmis sp. GSL018 TaxID=582737 RepID=A0A061QUD9_9CHLO
MCNAGACSDEHDQTIKSAALGGDHIVLCTQAGTVLSAGLDNFGQSSGRKTSNNFSIQRMHNRAATDLRPAICKRQAGRGRGLPLPGFVGRRPRLGLGRQHGRAGGRRRLVEVFGAVPCGGPGRPRGPPLGQRNARGHGAGGGARGRGGAPLCGRHGGTGGGLLCWGSNKHGQCGSAPGTSVPEPTLVGSLGGLCVVHASAGLGHTAACTDSGSVYCWGWNSNGQLGYPGEGIGHIDWQPALVEGRELDEEHVRKVACGSRHTVALCTSGRAYGWGWNEHGQLGLGRSSACQGSASLINVPLTVSDVACGQWHTLLVTDG